MLADFTLPTDGYSSPDLISGGAFRAAGGRVTCLAAAASAGAPSADARAVTLFAGTADGQLTVLPLMLPTLVGSTLEDVEVCSPPAAVSQ